MGRAAPIEISPKSYAVAVCLSMIFGIIGVQHFYLGRYLVGLSDVMLTVGFIFLFSIANDGVTFGLGVACLLADVGHTIVTTYLLFTGSFSDGKGRLIAYPGQFKT